MYQTVKLRELNTFITCGICDGYLIDATTITECLHTCEYATFSGASLFRLPHKSAFFLWLVFMSSSAVSAPIVYHWAMCLGRRTSEIGPQEF